MNFITFPVGTTNIFPLANSTAGGQLLSEWNIRSRESVCTNSEVKYNIGPSFTHGQDDFKLGPDADDLNVPISSTEIMIYPGRALVNGHFIESLESVVIDMAKANADSLERNQGALVGKLGIGLRAFYSTEATMAGAMMVESANMFTGIQVVVLPDADLKTPDDVPTNPDAVNCHLKLGTFQYTNGAVINVQQNADKTRYIGGERIANVDRFLNETCVTKSGLDPHNLYVFAGKYDNPEAGYSTWCIANDSLMVWDTVEPPTTTVEPIHERAVFYQADDQESVSLAVPHKQIDGMRDVDNNPLYYSERIINLPVADYANNTAGVVSKTYTKNIKLLSGKLANMYQLAKGKQVDYIETLDSVNNLPKINPNWEVGDYVLVKSDSTVDSDLDTIGAPSTIYAVVPGYVQEITFLCTVTDDTLPSALTGVELEEVIVQAEPTQHTPPSDIFPDFTSFRGECNKDYFVAKYEYTEPGEGDVEVARFKKTYFEVTAATPHDWSGTIQLTGSIPYAQEESIGGFKNVSDDTTYIDGGYVYLDSNGHLRLRDYTLLRSGTLAYQLGEDIPEFGNGEALSTIQETLDEFINDRIAFPTEAQTKTSDTPNVINITINLTDDEPETDDDDGIRNLYIRNIDSRFNTAVYFHFTGDATSKTIINFVDCERIRIGSNICGSALGDGTSGPVINIYRCGLYYDASVMDYIKTCGRQYDTEFNVYDFTEDALVPYSYPSWFTGMKDIKLWYQRYSDEDPNLTVDDMTVRELDVAMETEQIDFWTPLAPNDNHYATALSSLTFAGDGSVIGCGLLIASMATNNVMQGDSIIATTFTLPQGAGLTYPKSCMTRQLKITGTFTSGYNDGSKWYVTESSFTALAPQYQSMTSITDGSIALHNKTTIIDSNINSIPEWSSGTYNLFYGGIISATS